MKKDNGGFKMKDKFLTLCIKIQNQLQREEAQDLVEYALVIALVAFAATLGMKSLANSINSAFNTIGSTLTNTVG
jgi:pilus assembly protein Flp/PilA